MFWISYFFIICWQLSRWGITYLDKIRCLYVVHFVFCSPRFPFHLLNCFYLFCFLFLHEVQMLACLNIVPPWYQHTILCIVSFLEGQSKAALQFNTRMRIQLQFRSLYMDHIQSQLSFTLQLFFRSALSYSHQVLLSPFPLYWI